MKTKLWLFYPVLLLLAACAAPGSAETPTPSPTEEAGGNAGYTLEWLARLDPKTILLQQDFEPTFSRIEAMQPFGRVPAFTLYADGTLIFPEAGEFFDQQQVLSVQLSPEAALALVQEVMDAGFEGLEDYLDFCMPQDDGTQMCLADASFTVLRATLADGSFREVKSYANFSNDPAALEEILLILDGYENPDAQPYSPSQAALFYRHLAGDLEIPVSPWLLDSSLLKGLSEEIQAIVLEGEDLKTVIEGFGRNTGDFNIESGGETFAVYLVPWLPHTNYSADLAEAFPPQPELEPIMTIDENARKHLADLLGVSVDIITVTQVEFVEWPNGCLGIDYPDIACTEAIVPGFQLFLTVEGDEQVYEYRSNESGSLLLLAEPEDLREIDY